RARQKKAAEYGRPAVRCSRRNLRSSTCNGSWVDCVLVNRRNLALGLGLVVVLGLIAFQELRPLPTIGPTSLLAASRRLGPASPALPWPATGSSAVAVSGLGTLATHGPQTS